MNADISDAPERVIRKHHKRGVFYMVVCLMIGSVATTGTFTLIKRASSIDSPHNRSMSPVSNEGALIRASETPPSGDPGSSKPQGSSDIHLPASTARQTVFNDQNFTPRGADNVITLRLGSDIPPQKQPSTGVKLTIVRQSPKLKERACRPLKQGSIESRNCRALIGLKHRN
jgi:hypothetical protein